MKKTIPAAVLAVLALGTAALAEGMPAPGPDFGAHVSGMAPEHAIAHGVMFGQCVSSMANGSGGDCTHP